MVSFALTTMPLLFFVIYSSLPNADITSPTDQLKVGWDGTQDFEMLRRSSSSGDALYDKVSESIVLIHSIRPSGPARGSGFILSPGNILVTNEHVIGDAKFVIVETYWGQRLTISKIIASDERRDLAILPVPRELAHGGLKLSERTHAIGEKVYTVGAPRNTFFSISEGIISQFKKFRRAAQVVADLHGEPGASGSPMLDEDGNVLGVIARGNESEHLIYAVGYRELAALIKESHEAPLQSMR